MLDVWKYAGKYKKFLFFLLMIVSAEVFLEVYIPYLMSDILNEGIGNGNIHQLIKTGIIMAAVSVLLVGTGFSTSLVSSTFSEGFTKNLRSALFSKILDLSASDIDEIGKASIITRMSADMTYIKKAMGMIGSLIKCPIMIVITILMTMKIDMSLSWIFISITPLFALVLFVIIKLSRRHYRKMFENYDAMNCVLEEDTTNIRTIKAYERKKHEFERFDDAARSVQKESYSAEKITVLNNPILQLAVNVCVILLLYFGGYKIIEGRMLAGDLFCMITYTNQILGQVIIIALIIVPILSAQISMGRVFEVLKKKVSLTDESAEPEDESRVLDGSVRFENVSFGYYGNTEDKLVLKNISLNVPCGSFLGVIGSSGSAKSTIVNLLLRFYEADSCSIYVGSRDIKKMKFHALRGAIGVVPQKSTLFNGTIRENLLFGNENATEQDMLDSCRDADCLGFIKSFPEGFDTVISEGGTSVSGGQRQRLCIARALIRRPKILILDDSLSAVDTVTDSKINSALKKNYPDTTIIMIAQRISSIENADQIVVLDKGCVNGTGTHSQLLEKNRIYSEIYASQKRSME